MESREESNQTEVYTKGDELDCFVCPITCEVMQEPVISPCSGRSYEKAGIEAWVLREHTDPITRGSLELDQLIPNRNLKEAISIWKNLDENWQQKIGELQNRIKSQAGMESKLGYMQRRFNIQLRKRDSKGEKETIDDIPERFKNHELIKDALAFLVHENYQAAIDKFQKLLTEYPKDDWVCYRLAWLYFKYGSEYLNQVHFKSGIDYCQRAIELNNKNDEVYRLWGWLLHRIIRLNEESKDNEKLKAEELRLYTKALEINPRNAKALENLGMYYFFEENYDEAEKSFKESIKLSSENTQSMHKLSEIYCIKAKEKYKNSFFIASKNYFQLAETQYQQALSINLKDELTHFKFGMLYYDWGNTFSKDSREYFIKAIERFKESIKLNSQYVDAYGQCGYCYTRLGESYYDKAEELYNKALQINPDADRIKNNLRWLKDKKASRTLASPGDRDRLRLSRNDESEKYYVPPYRRNNTWK